MIKLKKLIKEHAWDRKFGEPLPTLEDVATKHQTEEKEPVSELDEAHPKLAKQIDSRIWRTLKYEIADQIGELVKVGEDYSVFQNAQYTAKALKQIQKLWSKLG